MLLGLEISAWQAFWLGFSCCSLVWAVVWVLASNWVRL